MFLFIYSNIEFFNRVVCKILNVDKWYVKLVMQFYFVYNDSKGYVTIIDRRILIVEYSQKGQDLCALTSEP